MRPRPVSTITLAALCLAVSAFAAMAQEEWKPDYYNPDPAEGDVILPMPCKGAMVFRRVETPSADGAIGDVPVILGQENDQQPYLNGLRRSFVSGPFSDGAGTARFFYMAKYELAQAQYDAVMAPSCPEKAPRRKEFLPATGIGKQSFDDFARAYTVWLMQNEPGALPKADETTAFLRLPTEEEWEFAARGGVAVDEAIFRAPLPPVPEGGNVSEYIAHGGTDSAGGKVQVIGTLKPNPLGLHDMLGNAAEFVETPFAVIRHGRLHGQAGGLIKRGGDARTPLSEISSATRFEVAPYDTNARSESNDRYTGTRLVLSGLAIRSQEQADELAKGLDALSKNDTPSGETPPDEEVIAIVEGLAAEAVTEDARRKLALVTDTIRRARAENNAQRDRSIRLILESGTLVCNQAVQRYLNALAIVNLLPSYDDIEAEARAAGDEATLADVDAAREEAMDSLRQLEAQAKGEVAEYANIVEGLAAEFSDDVLKRQSDFIRGKVEERGSRRANCLGILDTHLAARRATGFVDAELVELDLQGLARNEAGQN